MEKERHVVLFVCYHERVDHLLGLMFLNVCVCGTLVFLYRNDLRADLRRYCINCKKGKSLKQIIP